MAAPPTAIPAVALQADATAQPPLPQVGDREVDGHVARSVCWQGTKVAVQIAQYVVLARLVMPAEYGKFALVLPVLALFSALNDGGLSTAAVTGRRYDERLASDLYITQLGLGVIMAVLMALVAPVLAAVYQVPDLREIGWWLSLCLVVNAWGLQPKALLRRKLRVGPLAMVEIAGVVAGLAAALLLSSRISGVGLLIVAQVTSVAVGAAVAAVIAPVRLQAFRGESSYRKALEVGRHMVASDVLNATRGQIPAIALGFFVVLHDVGLYNRANQLLNLPLMVLAPALTNFLLPLLARDGAEPARRRSHVRRTLRLLLTATIPGCVWIALGPENLLAWVLGDEWRPAVSILSSLSPLFVVQVVAVIASITMVSAERSHSVRRFALWNLALTTLAVLATAPFGVMALALGLSISGLLLRAPLVVSYAIREGTLALADVLEAARLILLLAAAAAAVLWSVHSIPTSPIAREAIGLGAITVLSGLALLHTLNSRTRPVTT